MNFDPAFAREILPDLLRGAVLTLQATLGGMALALLVGLVLAIALRMRGGGMIDAVARFVRGTPLLVQLYLGFYVLPLAGPAFSAMTTGVTVLGLHYGAYLAEVYRAGIEGVARGQWEAASTLGLSRRATWLRVILPQAVPPMIPVLGNYLIAMFKDTPLLATITVPELFGAAQQVAGSSYRYTEPYLLVGAIFLALSWPAALAVGGLDRRLRRR